MNISNETSANRAARNTISIRLLALVALLAGPSVRSEAQTPLGTGLTWQGSLRDIFGEVTGNHDLRFRLFDADTGGSQAGPTIEYDAGALGTVAVDRGVFTVTLDFGGVFDGSRRWMEISVRPEDPSDLVPYVTLAPRIPLNAVPLARYASSTDAADTLGGQAVGPLMARSVYDTDGNGVVDTVEDADDGDAVIGNESNLSLDFDFSTSGVNLTDGGGTLTAVLTGLSAADGSPGHALTIDAAGGVTLETQAGTRPFGIQRNQYTGGPDMTSLSLTTTDGSGNQASRIEIEGGVSRTTHYFLTGPSGSETPTMTLVGANGSLQIGDPGSSAASLDVEGIARVTNKVAVESGTSLRAELDLDSSDDYAKLITYGTNDSDNMRMGGNDTAVDFGSLEVYDENSDTMAGMTAESNGDGELRLRARSGSGEIHIGYEDAGPLAGTPFVLGNGPNGNRSFQMSSTDPGGNGGLVLIADSAGNIGALIGMVGAISVVQADIKNFRIDHPSRPGMMLIHGAIEGPGAYVSYRGTASTEDGIAAVALPDYFEALTLEEGRTVQLTCRGGYSGLYVDGGVTNGGFVVRAAEGGNRTFDWEVKAERADIPRVEVEIPAEDYEFTLGNALTGSASVGN